MHGGEVQGILVETFEAAIDSDSDSSAPDQGFSSLLFGCPNRGERDFKLI